MAMMKYLAECEAYKFLKQNPKLSWEEAMEIVCTGEDVDYEEKAKEFCLY